MSSDRQERHWYEQSSHELVFLSPKRPSPHSDAWTHFVELKSERNPSGHFVHCLRFLDAKMPTPHSFEFNMQIVWLKDANVFAGHSVQFWPIAITPFPQSSVLLKQVDLSTEIYSPGQILHWLLKPIVPSSHKSRLTQVSWAKLAYGFNGSRFEHVLHWLLLTPMFPSRQSTFFSKQSSWRTLAYVLDPLITEQILHWLFNALSPSLHSVFFVKQVSWPKFAILFVLSSSLHLRHWMLFFTISLSKQSVFTARQAVWELSAIVFEGSKTEQTLHVKLSTLVPSSQ